MINFLLIVIPFLFGIISFFIRNDFVRRGLIIVCSSLHLIFVFLAWQIKIVDPFLNDWFMFDNTGIIFLIITSLLFFGASIYAVQYLREEKNNLNDTKNRSKFFSNEAIFSGCFLIFFSTMVLVIASQHLAIFWVGIEATTLVSAPLIYFHKTKRSLEATWKYLLICSVGIAIALLGIFFVSVANNNQGEMLFKKIVQNAGVLNLSWLKAAFLLLFVGYGTKMGLAPFHTWLPDAHSEAPSVISGLLSGALLNCAFLGILRIYQVCIKAGLGAYCQEIFIVFGLLSVLFAAIFILWQKDYKRMLAYSSVEHMGIIIFGMGLGGNAAVGALINMIGHSLTKAGLFFVAGNILSHFKTKKIAEIKGMVSGKMRYSAILWIIGFLLITGTPPSMIFLGKFIILKEALFQGKYLITTIFLSALIIVFIGMGKIFISMTQGEPCNDSLQINDIKKNFWKIFIPTVFFCLVIVIGIYLVCSEKAFCWS